MPIDTANASVPNHSDQPASALGQTLRSADSVQSVLSHSDAMKRSLRQVHAIIEERTKSLNGLSEWLQHEGPERETLASLLSLAGLPVNEENLYAAYMRLASMKEDGIRNAIGKLDIDREHRNAILGNALVYVEAFHTKLHDETLDQIEQTANLSPFHLGLLQSVHDIGLAFSRFQTVWNRHIIEDINPSLESLFDNDVPAIMAYLEREDLLDRGHGGEIADRSYSALVRLEDAPNDNAIPKFQALAYVEAFPEEIGRIVSKLELTIGKLALLDHPDAVEKEAYLRYFQTLVDAFSERDRHALVAKWAQVDVAWMSITSPFQVGHPLEYYEDHYRKAVAPEWDLRVQNSELFDSRIRSDVESMFRLLASERDLGAGHPVYDFSLGSLNRTQLYISSPGLYYGSFFTGLPSAQVVPNDAIVSKEHGKKIFSFAENILKQARSRPQMKLASLTLDPELRQKRKDILFGSDERYYRLYDIETIGHEFGHTLWLDTDTEALMNSKGEFKNIEEWKATTGGLLAFFLRPDPELQEDIVVDLVSRAVGLISWMKVEDVQPYYAEGLIHLHILFESGIVSVTPEGRIRMNYTDVTFAWLTNAYDRHYNDLVSTYVEKRDASEFLSKYAVRDGKTLLPTNPDVREFVLRYHALYEEHGNAVASEAERI